MDYWILDPGYNFGRQINRLFATNDKGEAIEAARDFGPGTVVVRIDREGNCQRIFTAPHQKDLALIE